MAIAKVILNGETLMDVTSNTASANNMLSGIIGTKNDGTQATGNIATKTSANLTASGSTVTAAAGYYATSVSKSVAAGSAFPPAVTITKNPTFSFVSSTGKITASYTGSSSVTPTVTSGYVTAGTTGTISTTGTSTYTLTTQAAQTLYPSTADQTVASYRWLTGTQTFKSVMTSNLTAENIAEGVVVKVGDSSNASRITQVTGTHSGATTYTATISGSGDNACYVTYNGTNYNTNGNTFTFKAGDTLTVHGNGHDNVGSVYINGEHIYTGHPLTYLYTLPIGDISIELSPGSSDTIYIYTYVKPSGTYNITSSGTYNIYGYSTASVDTAPIYTATISGSGNSSYCWIKYNNTKYYTNGNTFTFYEGETITVYTKGNSAYTYDYTLPAGNIIIEIIYTSSSNNSINILESIIPINTFNITSNGLYNVYSYSQASVEVTNEYYYVYKALASNAGLSSGTSQVTEWCNSLSSIDSRQFEGKNFSGTFTFTNVSYIGAGAFARARIWNVGPMTSFSLNFPSAHSIGSSAFVSNFGLKSISAPNVDIIWESAFFECRILSYVNFSACTSIYNYAFASCLALQNVSFPSCSQIGPNAFMNCGSLISANFSVCTYIYSNAFTNCSQLTTINFPECTTIDNYAFSGCRKLTTINFPKCTSINTYVFSYCTSLSIANFSSCVLIGSNAFDYCTNLTTISFPVCTIIESRAFMNCRSLSSVNFPSCTSINAAAFQSCYSLVTVNASLCTRIGDNAFAYCSALEEVNFPQCSILGRSAFSSCANLTVASFPICTSMSMQAFASCYNLISLYLNNVSVVPSISTNTFMSTPISTYSTVAGRYGSVFVPSSLYASFLADTNWKAYSARLVSV